MADDAFIGMFKPDPEPMPMPDPMFMPPMLLGGPPMLFCGPILPPRFPIPPPAMLPPPMPLPPRLSPEFGMFIPPPPILFMFGVMLFIPVFCRFMPPELPSGRFPVKFPARAPARVFMVAVLPKLRPI
jgi:hypothetical protein